MSDYEHDQDDEIQSMSDDVAIKKAAEGITITIPTYAIEALSEAAAHRLTEHMTKKLDAILKKKVEDICNDAWVAAITDRARASADEYILKPRTPTNTWGEPDPSKKQIALGDQIPGIVDNWLNQKVDSSGNPDRDSYGNSRGNTKRIDWMLRSLVTEPLKAETEKAAKSVEAEARKVVAAHVGRFVAETMIPSIDIKSLK